LPFILPLISCPSSFVLFAAETCPQESSQVASHVEAGGGISTRSWDTSEEIPAKAFRDAVPLISVANLKDGKGELKMTFEQDQYSMMQEQNLLKETAASMGFTASDIKALIESELETSQVLDYITAVISNRMN
jgi:hypothetical protein